MLTIPTSRRAATVAATWLLYVAAFGPLHGLLDAHAGVLAFVPVVTAGAMVGTWGGAISGVAAVPATLIAAWLASVPMAIAAWTSGPALVGAAAMLVVGTAVGRIRDLGERAGRETARRAQAEASRDEHTLRLAIVNEVARTLRGDGDVTEIAAKAVEMLHRYFPEYRAAYSTVDDDGRITVLSSVHPGGPLIAQPMQTPLVLSPEQMERLSALDVYQVDDVRRDVTWGPLAEELARRGTRALIDAPTRHPQVRLGLLSLSGSEPHEWTESERTTLRHAADFLADTLDDVERRQRLRESEARFRTLAEENGAGILLLRGSEVIYANRALQRITGYSEEELRRAGVLALVHPDDKNDVEERIARRLQGDPVDTPFEGKFVTKTGEERWLESRAATIVLDGEQVILSITLDTTERRRAEERLRASEGRFRAILEQSTDGVGVVVDGKIVYANPTTTDIFGYDIEELIGLDPMAFLSPGERRRARRRIEQAIGSEPLLGPAEYEAVRKDGTTFPLEVFSRQIEFEGRPALLSTLRDLTEKRRAEERVSQSEARLHTLLEHHFEGIAVAADGQLLYVNRSLAAMFGCDPEDLIGASPLSLVSPAERPRAARRLQELASGQAHLHPAEYVGVRQDGTTFPLEVFARATDFGGRRAVLGSFRDLTERRQVQAAVQEAEEKYRTLVESSLAGVYIIQHRRFVYVNPRLAEIMGYSQDEMLLLPNTVAITFQADRSTLEDRVRRRLAGESVTDQHWVRAQRKDGRVIDLEIHGGVTTYRGESAVIGTVLDVTARRRAEEQLRESERRFRTLFESAPIGLVMASPRGRVQRVNATFCVMLDRTEDELVEQELTDLAPVDDAGDITAALNAVRANPGPGVRRQARYIRRDGSTVETETTLSMARSETDEPLYVVAMVEDVTERRRLEDQLEQVLRLESVGELAGGVAHNFNNALTAISGYSEVLARRLDETDPARRDVEQIKRVTERSADLTRQLLTFSRREPGHPSVFSLNDAVESAHDLLSPLLGERLRLRLRLDRSLPDISCDRSQAEQVVTNLVMNAKDAMRDGGLLTIETEAVDIDDADLLQHPDARRGRYVCLRVRDTGVGVRPELLRRIFEPFFTTKEPGEGVGLGLAMVHGAVRQHGGFVSVESTPAQGSTFSVHFPPAATRTEAGPAEPAPPTIH